MMYDGDGDRRDRALPWPFRLGLILCVICFIMLAVITVGAGIWLAVCEPGPWWPWLLAVAGIAICGGMLLLPLISAVTGVCLVIWLIQRSIMRKIRKDM